jgi:serine/threonine protein kinase
MYTHMHMLQRCKDVHTHMHMHYVETYAEWAENVCTLQVGDFGLSLKMDTTDTHVSSVFQGTLTHLAPEVLLHGRVSKAADLYAFGITMFECVCMHL